MRSVDDLRTELSRIDELLKERPESITLRAETVSAWSIAQQLHHLQKADTGVLSILKKAGPDRQGSIRLLGRIVLFIGRIPRGTAKAPSPTLPEEASLLELIDGMQQIRNLLDEITANPALLNVSAPRFVHPYFGTLTVQQTFRFMVIHHRHHWKIIRDIEKASAKRSGR